MTTHAMIDIETLDTAPASVVLSVGAVKFDPHSDQEPHAKTLWRPSIEDQLERDRSVSDDTLEWWSRQDADIREQAMTEQGRIQMSVFMAELNRYLVGCDEIWCQGPQFDMVILENLYSMYNHHTNWQYWQIRDSRTLFSIMPRDPRKDIQQNLHSADDDAYWQAVCVQKTFGHFGVTQ